MPKIFNEPKKLKVLPPTVVLDRGTNWALNPCTLDEGGDFVMGIFPPVDTCRAQNMVCTPHYLKQFERICRYVYKVLIPFHQVEAEHFVKDVFSEITWSSPT